MSHEEPTKPARRGRAIAVAGLAAALAGSGLIAANSATAAPTPPTPPPTAPTLTATASSSVANDGTGQAQYSLEINNSQAGNGPIGVAPGSATYTATKSTLVVTVNVPSGLLCSNIQITPGTATPGTAVFPNFQTLPSATAAGTCVYSTEMVPPPAAPATDVTYTQPANSDWTFNYNVSVNAIGSTTPVGTITSSASLSQNFTTTSNGNVAAVNATSNTTSTTLAAPAAPTFVTGTPGPGIVFNQFSFPVVASTGVPSTTPVSYSAFGTPTAKGTDGTYPAGVLNNYTGQTLPFGFGPLTGDPALPLFKQSGPGAHDTGFYLDLKTGAIVNDGNSGTDAFPAYTWTIIANNGEGGATSGTPANPGGTTAPPSPKISKHDVVSPAYTLVEKFSDVATTNIFAKAIYTLGAANVIGGFGDGTFRPTLNVTREGFAKIVALTLGAAHFGIGNGVCTTNKPSAFADVPNNSAFCASIRDLASAGIIKGFSATEFGPTQAITRQAIAGLLYRAYQYQVTGGNPSDTNADAVCTTPIPFKDVTSSNVFCGDIEFLHSRNVSNGYTDGTYRPANPATRQETAQLVYGLFESDFVTV